MRIFVVDDDASIVAVMTALLEAAGHTVASNLNGTKAIPEIVAAEPDCLLTDVMLKDMDGLDLCRALRQDHGMTGMRIIAVSGNEDDDSRQRAVAAGADGYLVKPFDSSTFAAEVEAIAGG